MDTHDTDPAALDPETLADDYLAWLDARAEEAREHQDAAAETPADAAA